jgi:hypothetical protein
VQGESAAFRPPGVNAPCARDQVSTTIGSLRVEVELARRSVACGRPRVRVQGQRPLARGHKAEGQPPPTATGAGTPRSALNLPCGWGVPSGKRKCTIPNRKRKSRVRLPMAAPRRPPPPPNSPPLEREPPGFSQLDPRSREPNAASSLWRIHFVLQTAVPSPFYRRCLQARTLEQNRREPRAGVGLRSSAHSTANLQAHSLEALQGSSYRSLDSSSSATAGDAARSRNRRSTARRSQTERTSS